MKCVYGLMGFLFACMPGKPDWVVVQLDSFSQPAHCWELHEETIHEDTVGTSLWWSSPSGNDVHMLGPHIRVRVRDGHWEQAYREAGTTSAACKAKR